MMYFIVVYYKIRDIATIRKIQERFKFPKRMTVNGEWQVLVEGTDWETLRETERRGYIEIRNKAIRNMKATNLFIKRIEVLEEGSRYGSGVCKEDARTTREDTRSSM